MLPDGDLEAVNKQWIGGMRGCYVEVDDEKRYLFVGGHHDGRVTMMHLEKDGSIGTMVFSIKEWHAAVTGVPIHRTLTV